MKPYHMPALFQALAKQKLRSLPHRMHILERHNDHYTHSVAYARWCWALRRKYWSRGKHSTGHEGCYFNMVAGKSLLTSWHLSRDQRKKRERATWVCGQGGSDGILGRGNSKYKDPEVKQNGQNGLGSVSEGENREGLQTWWEWKWPVWALWAIMKTRAPALMSAKLATGFEGRGASDPFIF